MLRSVYQLPTLPPPVEFETVSVLKALNSASRALANLRGQALTIPNQGILIDTLALQEAKASSEIESIVTTQDEIFKVGILPEDTLSVATKEVALYRSALHRGYGRLREMDGIISNTLLIDMFRLLKQRDDGFRSVAGTSLRNDKNGQVVYVPPQEPSENIAHMTALENFINNDELCELDPLIKMAIIHHQFESIHPFADGNGRIGRILNVLYLVRTGLLDIPILYLSRYINQNKSEYYRLLQQVRDSGGSQLAWEAWVVYMLQGVADTAQTTLYLVENIRTQMAAMKLRLREEVPKIYSHELLNNLFRHPYTRIEYLQSDLGLKARQTASRYLDTLYRHGFVDKRRSGKNNYYINTDLVRLFLEVSGGR